VESKPLSHKQKMDRLSNRLNDSKKKCGGLAQCFRNICPKPQEPLPTANQKPTQNKTFSMHPEKYVISAIDKSYYPKTNVHKCIQSKIPEENMEEEVKKREQKFAHSRH
jgi:hypothetical protein